MRVLPIIFSVLGMCLIALALWKVPAYQVQLYKANNPLTQPLDEDKRVEHNREMFKLENDLRSNYAQLTGGVVLLLGLYLTWRKQRHEEHISNQTLRLTEDGKITERYSKAIELLGSDNQAVRIGGIYALERIARDSEKDHWTVMEALCAFIRDESNKTSANADPAPPISKSNEGEGTNLPSDTKIRSDIQIGLTVVGRRSWHDTESTQKLRIDLRRAKLAGADLIGVNLRSANLIGADLSEANLIGADLSRANLSGARLIEANLIGANLIGADLSGANLSGANLHSAKLFGANLSEANLRRSHLRGAGLMKANLSGAGLIEANLSGAGLSGANLSGANLSKANLSNADLIEAKLIRAKYNKDTVFPTGFNSDNKEMIMID